MIKCSGCGLEYVSKSRKGICKEHKHFTRCKICGDKINVLYLNQIKGEDNISSYKKIEDGEYEVTLIKPLKCKKCETLEICISCKTIFDKSTKFSNVEFCNDCSNKEKESRFRNKFLAEHTTTCKRCKKEYIWSGNGRVKTYCQSCIEAIDKDKYERNHKVNCCRCNDVILISGKGNIKSRKHYCDHCKILNEIEEFYNKYFSKCCKCGSIFYINKRNIDRLLELKYKYKFVKYEQELIYNKGNNIVKLLDNKTRRVYTSGYSLFQL